MKVNHQHSTAYFIELAEQALALPILPLEQFNREIQAAVEVTTGDEQLELALLKLRTNTRFDRMRRARG